VGHATPSLAPRRNVGLEHDMRGAVEIDLVSEDDKGEARARGDPRRVNKGVVPKAELLEGRRLVDGVHEDAHVRAAVKLAVDGREAFHPGRVPDLCPSWGRQLLGK